MFDISNLETNLKSEDEGVWLPLGKGARVKVARIGNPAYQKALRSRYKANRAVLDMEDEAAAETAEQIAIQVYARTILKGWEGISVNNEEFPFSVENAEKLLTKKDFRERIKNYADAMENFQDKKEEEAISD